MGQTIPTQTRFPTPNQNPSNSILDVFNKQVYLGNQFSYAASITPGATSETLLLLLNNASTTKSLFVCHRKLITVTASQTCILRYYLNPTVTGAGTPVTPTNLRIANANVSVATLGTSPTASANGTLFCTLSSTPAVSDSSDFLTILDPEQSILVTSVASSNSTVILTELNWFEL